jgi:hypothetical protein
MTVGRLFGLLGLLQLGSLLLLREPTLKGGCGLLADGQTCQSNNHSGIRRDRVYLSGAAGCW